jgi:hypothetical protein
LPSFGGSRKTPIWSFIASSRNSFRGQPLASFRSVPTGVSIKLYMNRMFPWLNSGGIKWLNGRVYHHVFGSLASKNAFTSVTVGSRQISLEAAPIKSPAGELVTRAPTGPFKTGRPGPGPENERATRMKIEMA